VSRVVVGDIVPAVPKFVDDVAGTELDNTADDVAGTELDNTADDVAGTVLDNTEDGVGLSFPVAVSLELLWPRTV